MLKEGSKNFWQDSIKIISRYKTNRNQENTSIEKYEKKENQSRRGGQIKGFTRAIRIVRWRNESTRETL